MHVYSDSELLRLSCLIGNLLRPFTELDAVSLTKEREKDLLLALSQVLREIQSSTGNSSTSSQKEEDYKNLANITSHLMILLTFNSQYVRHLASNVLVSISQFLVYSENFWEFFIGSLTVCVELGIRNIFQLCSSPSKIGVEGLGSESRSFAILFKPKLQNADWFTVASLVQALRNILKFLKEDDSHAVLIRSYLNSICDLLSNVTWAFMDGYLGGCESDQELDFGNAAIEGQITVFLGNFLQLLCSVVDQFTSAGAFDDYPDKQAIVSIAISLVPKILGCSLVKKSDDVNLCVSQYFRHKSLVLMTRLSFQSCQNCSVSISWLQLLHEYFKELLFAPISPFEDHSNCLEDTPFLQSVCDGNVSSVSAGHLRRQAIFLFLRCSLSLINIKDGTDMCRLGATDCSSLVCEASLDHAFCSRQKGFLQLYTWLCHCLEIESGMDHDVHVEKVVNFISSLLKLYVHEDDLLFRLMLLLLSVPFCQKKFSRGSLVSHDVQQNILVHVSNIFNPIRLFILFLAEIHYDHQVLLDYLISKDTGISCAEYLLRCLRAVCDSWREFVELLAEIEVINQSPSKRRKTSVDSSNFESVSPCKSVNSFQLKQSKSESGDDFDHRGTKEWVNVGVRDCLLSLKKCLENLHCKHLFPYNPGVLLKRFIRFFNKPCLLVGNDLRPIGFDYMEKFVLLFNSYKGNVDSSVLNLWLPSSWLIYFAD